MVFEGCEVALATKHGKERLLGPLLRDRLGLRLVHVTSVDTDEFGTFTRTIARAGTALETARRKARAALEARPQAAFGLASEGSFGPHPALPWVAAGHELVLLIDRQGTFELVGEDLTEDTNFQAATAHTLDEAVAFATRIGFPAHAVVAGGLPGLQTLEALEAAFHAAGAPLALEADMRAHVNPTRQHAILRAGSQLAAACLARCPRCERPGFVERRVEPGLPCETCRAPTHRPRAYLAQCPCGERRARPADTPFAATTWCDACNP